MQQGRKVISVTLNVAWFLVVPDGLDWVFSKLLICGDFPTQSSAEFSENGLKKRQYPVSGISLDKNPSLMPEVRNLKKNPSMYARSFSVERAGCWSTMTATLFTSAQWTHHRGEKEKWICRGCEWEHGKTLLWYCWVVISTLSARSRAGSNTRKN